MTNGLKKKVKGREKYLHTNENRKTTYKILWKTTKTVLKGKFIAINMNIKKRKAIM
jgi:CxxC motif-containing protein (DUF1111 family)